MAAPPEMVTIRVEMLSGTSCEVELNATAKVSQAKDEIEQLLGIPAQEQRLVWAGTVLDDDLTPFAEAAAKPMALQLVRMPKLSLARFSAERGMELDSAANLCAAIVAAAEQGEQNPCLEAQCHELFADCAREQGEQLLCALAVGGLATAFEGLIEHQDYGQVPGVLDRNVNALGLAAKRGLPLHCAALLRSPNFAKASRIRSYPRAHCTALHHAANEAILRQLLEDEDLRSRECLDATDNRGCTCLHYSSSEGTTRLLLGQAEFTAAAAEDEEGQTALHWARNAAMVSALLEHPAFGPAVAARDRKGKTALHVLVVGEGIAVPLLERLRQEPQLLDVNCTDLSGCTALHYAGSGAVCEALFRSGFTSLDAKNRAGRTALHTARNASVARAILAQQSFTEVDAKDSDGLTALALALRNRNHEVAQAIVSSGRTKAEVQPGEEKEEEEAPACALSAPGGEQAWRGCKSLFWCTIS